MKLATMAVLWGTVCFSAAASAASGSLQLGVIADSKLEDENYGFEADGDGFSVNASVSPADTGLMFFVGYLGREYEDILDVKQTRLGAGWSGVNDRLGFWAGINYEKLADNSSDANGLGFRGGLSLAVAERLTVYGELGSYVLSGDGADVTGGEFSIGLAFEATTEVALFADVRAQALEFEYDSGDPNDEFSIVDLRVGVGFFF